MSGRRGRKGNIANKLKKQLAAQRELEEELEQLNTAKDTTHSAKAIIGLVVENGRDPMLNEENPFVVAPVGCSCTVL
eukprot:CAMPEP_0202713990 /NCGR_PEP_ID=MMETSP1385-20130828/62263_1 /ASSEMBLY_ACC=CAM_ASM_000861 /TAXON_ID=933848 /ORGANISM="Elphidium margaritaceum" /LENGTH=76 /DNA_ID=CAMNT_0049374551 /DNA_START=33 /DNA_END=263 /DNA_ORIENTATION=-